jgi:hypothetical protein
MYIVYGGRRRGRGHGIGGTLRGGGDWKRVFSNLKEGVIKPLGESAMQAAKPYLGKVAADVGSRGLEALGGFSTDVLGGKNVAEAFKQQTHNFVQGILDKFINEPWANMQRQKEQQQQQQMQQQQPSWQQPMMMPQQPYYPPYYGSALPPPPPPAPAPAGEHEPRHRHRKGHKRKRTVSTGARKTSAAKLSRRSRTADIFD